jgi:hypothetical protein
MAAAGQLGNSNDHRLWQLQRPVVGGPLPVELLGGCPTPPHGRLRRGVASICMGDRDNVEPLPVFLVHRYLDATAAEP